MIFTFDACVLDTAQQELWRDGERVHVEPQVFAVLEHLVANKDRVVSKIELLDEVWGDRFVSESALTSRIKLARKACGDNGREQRIVKTVHSRGYRFVAPVAAGDGSRTGDRPDRASAPPRGLEHAESGTEPGGRNKLSMVVGRDDEMAVLEDALRDTRTGDRRAVFVTGGIGSGKSTLVAEFLERQDDLDQWLVCTGRCLQTRGGVEPYFCLLEALGQLARTAPDLVRDTLDGVAPSWLTQMPALVDAATIEHLERRLLGSTAHRMLREGADAFGALAMHRPLILVLEDLHWADDCTLDVVDLLLQRVDRVPLLLVGTIRTDQSSPAPAVSTAAAGGRARVLALGPLDYDAIGTLAGDRLDDAVVPDELVAVLADRSDGVPLFAEEILSSWIRQGQVAVDDGLAMIAGSLDQMRRTVPDTVPQLMQQYLLELDGQEVTVLEACAVSGETFDAASVAAGLTRGTTETEGVLSAMAARRGLIGATGASSWPDGTVSASYSFIHSLYRQVIYDQIPASRRSLLHRLIGEALEAGYTDRVTELAAVLAEHFTQAAEPLKAVRYLAMAGEQAAARSAHGHAAAFLNDALDRLLEMEPSPERARAELEVRMTLGPALVATKGWFDASVSANYERALELCGNDDHCPEAALARYGLATVSELQGRFARTEALLLPLLDGEDGGHLAMEAHELVACSTFHQGAFDRSLHNAAMVLESWDEDDYSVLMARIAEHPASSCNSWSSLANWALGRSDDSLRQAERAVTLGERNLYALSTAVQQRAMLHQLRNERDLCMEWADRCRRVGEDQNFPMRTIQADIYKGWAMGVSGNAEGARLIADGIARFRGAGATLNEPYYVGLHADVLLHTGDPAGATALLGDAFERMEATTRTYFYQSELHRLMARAHLDLEGPTALDDARASLEESHAVARQQGARALQLRTVMDRFELECAHGDPEPARAALTQLVEAFADQQPTPDVIRARGLLAG